MFRAELFPKNVSPAQMGICSSPCVAKEFLCLAWQVLFSLRVYRTLLQTNHNQQQSSYVAFVRIATRRPSVRPPHPRTPPPAGRQRLVG